MSKLKNILAATDLSPRGDKALARAAHLAREHSARLAILYVQQERARENAKFHRIAGTIEKGLHETIAAWSLDDAAAITLVSGRPSAEIIRHAREAEADLIVAGDRGANLLADLIRPATADRKTLPQLFMGSVAQYVMREVQCDVLVVQPARTRMELDSKSRRAA